MEVLIFEHLLAYQLIHLHFSLILLRLCPKICFDTPVSFPSLLLLAWLLNTCQAHSKYKYMQKPTLLFMIMYEAVPGSQNQELSSSLVLFVSNSLSITYVIIIFSQYDSDITLLMKMASWQRNKNVFLA